VITASAPAYTAPPQQAGRDRCRRSKIDGNRRVLGNFAVAMNPALTRDPA